MTKEVVGDYKYDVSVITGIERSLGQTFYKAQGEGKPLLRSDIVLVKESEEGVEAAAPADNEEEPYVFYKRQRIIARDKDLRENKADNICRGEEGGCESSRRSSESWSEG